MNLKNILVSPIVTEKSSQQMDKGRYVFKVLPEVSKNQLKVAVEQAFGVKVRQVWSSNMLGKVKRVGNSRRLTNRNDWKKMTVQLDKDQKIALFEAEK